MHEPTRISFFIMLPAKLSHAFLVGVFNRSEDYYQSQPSKLFKTMMNIKYYPLLNKGIFQQKHAQFDLKIKLELSLWTCLLDQDKNAIA